MNKLQMKDKELLIGRIATQSVDDAPYDLLQDAYHLMVSDDLGGKSMDELKEIASDIGIEL